MISHRENSFRAVHRSTPQDLPVRYAENEEDFGTTDYTDATDGFLDGVRRGGRPTIRRRVDVPGLPLPDALHFFVRVIRAIRGRVSCSGSARTFSLAGRTRIGL